MMTASRPIPDRSEPLVAHEDLAGLAVHDVNDLRVGHVFGVLTEAATGLVRFLDVEVDGRSRHVLIPVGHARLECVLGQRRIRLRAASVEDLEDVPSYQGERASIELARSMATLYGRLFRGARYYAHPAYDHRGLYAGDHPIVREEELPAAALDLLRLSDAKEFQVAPGESDVRGWAFECAGESCGRVRDLIIDPKADQVRYLEVELPDGGTRLLPIGYVELEPEKSVLAPGLSTADVHALPSFAGLPLERAQEIALLSEIERALDARNPFLRVDYSGREMAA